MGCVTKKQTQEQLETQPDIENNENNEDFGFQVFFKSEEIFASEYDFIKALIDDNQLDEIKVKVRGTKTTRIALRFMKPQDKAQDLAMQQNLRLLLKVNHPFLQKSHGVYEFPDKYFLVREYVQGINIFEMLKKHNFKERNIALAIQALLQALNYLHKRNIYHGQLCTHCIVYDPAQKHSTPILCSYGLVALGQKDLSGSFPSPLTPDCYYRSPECIKGENGKMNDIWSIGVLTYFLNTSIMPFDGKDGVELRRCIQKGVANYEITELHEISDEGQQIIKKMLKYAIQFRPSAQECLAHPWFLTQMQKITDSDKKKLMSRIEHMHKFHFTNKLQQAATLILVEKNMTEQQHEQLQKQFQKLDGDKSGSLTKEEILKALLMMMDEKQAQKELQEVFQKGDLDGHGEIDFYEFLMVFGHKKKYATEDKVRKLFKSADKDNSGMLSLKEVKQLLVTLNVSEQEFNQIMGDFDKNGDGQISEAEFIDGLMSMIDKTLNDKKEQAQKSPRQNTESLQTDVIQGDKKSRKKLNYAGNQKMESQSRPQTEILGSPKIHRQQTDQTRRRIELQPILKG